MRRNRQMGGCLNIMRLLRAQELLERGATEAPGPGGSVQLHLDGRIEMTTEPGTIAAAREVMGEMQV